MGDVGCGAWCVMSPQCEAALVSPCLETEVGWVVDGVMDTGSS